MTTNLRERAESDLKSSLEKEWALPVQLSGPDGVEDGVDSLLVGQVLYDYVKISPETGEEMTVNKPVVTLRRSSLTRVPEPGENWSVKIPIDPSTTATLQNFVLDKARPPEGGRSIGFIRLYLTKAEQSV